MDLLSSTPTYIIIALELTAALSSSIYFFRSKNKKLLPIIFLLWYTILNEIFAVFYAIYIDKFCENIIVHNIYELLSFSILFYVFYSHIINFMRRRIIIIFFSLYIIAEIANIIYVDFDIFKNLVYAYLAGCILIALSILYYGIDLLYIKNINRLEKNPLVWISIAYMIFFVSYPVLQFTNLFVGDEASDSFYNTLNFTHFIIVVLMYLLIIIGFLWNREKFKFSR